MKRIFSSVLCALLAASVLASCGNGGSGSSTANSGSSSSGVTMSANGEYPIVSEKVTYTVMAPHTDYYEDLRATACARG